ncbi:hypothetical protein EV385_3550 [Krasilnikovia cinnamomea]|uniref:Uncharacterized protein n=1 Tax=Krasilnikovia cinnamomea TaxID=349313 RepID=A0A4Q7ZL96_9ACTN|nr:hypothetical protein EV385_3550 [Krasilnikovia cinnamomea]
MSVPGVTRATGEGKAQQVAGRTDLPGDGNPERTPPAMYRLSPPSDHPAAHG